MVPHDNNPVNWEAKLKKKNILSLSIAWSTQQGNVLKISNY